MESEGKSFDSASESRDDYMRRLGLYEIWVQGRYKVVILGDGRVWLELVNLHSESFLRLRFRGTLSPFEVSDLWPSKPEKAVEALWKMTRRVLPPDVKIPDPELVVSYAAGLGGTVPVGLIPSVEMSMDVVADELRLAEQAFIQPMKGIQRVLRVCLAEANFGKDEPREPTLYVPGISEPPWLWGVWEQIKRCEEHALIVELLAAFLDGSELFDPSIPKPLGGAQYGGVLYYLDQIDGVRRIIGEKARRWLSLRIIRKAAVYGNALAPAGGKSQPGEGAAEQSPGRPEKEILDYKQAIINLLPSEKDDCKKYEVEGKANQHIDPSFWKDVLGKVDDEYRIATKPESVRKSVTDNMRRKTFKPPYTIEKVRSWAMDKKPGKN